MFWNGLLGNAATVDRLRESNRRGRLAHTYAFVGPAGVGKKRCALMLAQCLLCQRREEREFDACGECPGCRQVMAHMHPDLLIVERPKESSVLPIKLFIGEKETRGKEGLCHDLALRPMAGRRRIGIIDEAELLTTESGNALLKTLEEPPDYAVLIIIATSTDLLLPTIRSRCQVATFQPLDAAQVQTLLLREGLTENEVEAAEIARLSEGSLETARQLVDPALREQRGELYDLLAAQPFDCLATAARMNSGIEAAGSEKGAQRAHAGWLVRFAIEFFRRALGTLSGGPGRTEDEIPQVARFASRLTPGSLASIDHVADLLERCLIADHQLDANAAIPLCVESLCNDLGRMQRT